MKVSAKQHQLADSWAAAEISVSEILLWKYLAYVTLILCNYKKAKEDKNFRFTITSILSEQ